MTDKDVTITNIVSVVLLVTYLIMYGMYFILADTVRVGDIIFAISALVVEKLYFIVTINIRADMKLDTNIYVIGTVVLAVQVMLYLIMSTSHMY